MAHTSEQIKVPVSIYDVQSILANSNSDLGTLISQGDINPWAKFKPVKYKYMNTAPNYDTTNGRWNSQAAWWKADDGKCGFVIETSSDLGSPTTSNTFLYKLINGQLGWVYDKPEGGTSSPFRLLDFADYLHTAVNPVGDIGSTRIPVDRNYNFTIAYDSTADYSDPYNPNLQYSDIEINGTALSSFYLGVLMISGNTWIVATATTTFRNNDTTISITGNQNMVNRKWKIIPLFSDSVIIPETYNSGTYLSANKSAQDVYLYSTSNMIQVLSTATFNTTHNRLTVETSIINYSSTTSVSGVFFCILTTAGSEPPAEGTTVISNVYYNNGNAITINTADGDTPGVTTLETKTVTLNNYSESKNYWVGGGCDDMSTSYSQCEEPPEVMPE